jgi:hypothetical protein
MKELGRLCGPTSPAYIRAQLVWLRLCCNRGRGSLHFKDILPSIQSILVKMKDHMWFTASEEKQFLLLHAQVLAQSNLWQAAADKLLHWQADYCRDYKLKTHMLVLRSHTLAAHVLGHLGDVKAVERQHDAAISRSFSQRHLMLWAKGKQLLQMAQDFVIKSGLQLNSSVTESADSSKVLICEAAAKAFSMADACLSLDTLTPALASFRCQCILSAAEALTCSGSDSNLALAQDLCQSCESLCRSAFTFASMYLFHFAEHHQYSPKPLPPFPLFPL